MRCLFRAVMAECVVTQLSQDQTEVENKKGRLKVIYSLGIFRFAVDILIRALPF